MLSLPLFPKRHLAVRSPLLAFLAAAAAGLALASPARADYYPVTRTDDTAPTTGGVSGDLRYAITQANLHPGSAVELQSVTVTLQAPLPPILVNMSVGAFPAGTFPQVAIDDPKMYPVYQTCVDLGISIWCCAGVPGPRLKFAPQEVARIDTVLGENWSEGGDVAERRPLPELHPHAGPELGERVLARRGLVARVDSGGDVGLEPVIADAGEAPVAGDGLAAL